MKVSLKISRAQYAWKQTVFYVLGLRCWGLDGIRQMYLYVFVGYWFVSPLGEYICTNVLVQVHYHFQFHFQFYELVCSLCTYNFIFFIFAIRCLATLLYVGLPVWDLGSCFFPILVVGT